MQKIILANRQEFEVTRCGAAGGYLWVGFPDGVIDFSTAAQILSDKNATSKIISTYDFAGMEVVYDGYTELQSIQLDYDNSLLVSLKQR